MQSVTIFICSVKSRKSSSLSPQMWPRWAQPNKVPTALTFSWRIASWQSLTILTTNQTRSTWLTRTTCTTFGTETSWSLTSSQTPRRDTILANRSMNFSHWSYQERKSTTKRSTTLSILLTWASLAVTTLHTQLQSTKDTINAAGNSLRRNLP